MTPKFSAMIPAIPVLTGQHPRPNLVRTLSGRGRQARLLRDFAKSNALIGTRLSTKDDSDYSGLAGPLFVVGGLTNYLAIGPLPFCRLSAQGHAGAHGEPKRIQMGERTREDARQRTKSACGNASRGASVLAVRVPTKPWGAVNSPGAGFWQDQYGVFCHDTSRFMRKNHVRQASTPHHPTKRPLITLNIAALPKW